MLLLALLDSPPGGADWVTGQHEEVTVSQGGHTNGVGSGGEEGGGTVDKLGGHEGWLGDTHCL